MQAQLGLHFVLFPGPSSSDDQVFGERGRCDLSPPPSRLLGFLGAQPAHLLRRMLTAQNPKKSWLVMKPACSLVDNASLGPRLPPSSSGCPHLPVTGEGCAGLHPASSAQSFLFFILFYFILLYNTVLVLPYILLNCGVGEDS